MSSSLLKSLALGAALIAIPAEASRVETVFLNSTRAQVERIIDGDTFDATLMDPYATPVRIRIKGIDCPESRVNPKCIKRNGSKRACQNNEVPRGLEAKKYAASQLNNQTITLETGLEGDNKNIFEQEVRDGERGRILAYIKKMNGKDYGLGSIEAGYCENNDRFPHKRKSVYKAAE